MILCQESCLTFYRFELYDSFPGLVHGVTTRVGGISPQGLNLAFGPHDSAANVQANLDLVSRAVGFDRLVCAKQVHGDRSLVVGTESDCDSDSGGEALGGFDALITADRGLGLLVTLADCQGVVLFDPARNVVAVVHNGWRGSVADILGKTVFRLKKDFRVRPGDLLVGISPSLGPCCAEFDNYTEELPPEFWKYRIRDQHFDFWDISRDQLTAAGVRSENIEVAEVCTVCDDAFFSFRREKLSNRFGLMAGLA
ncbi:MAG: laccase domain-containing protein [Deltaproteobacteria bacterium]|nr:laccase domain-containing protein [Deltaproteobacteria bacterium]